MTYTALLLVCVRGKVFSCSPRWPLAGLAHCPDLRLSAQIILDEWEGFKKCVGELGVACIPVVPVLQRQRQAGLWEFSVSLLFTV